MEQFFLTSALCLSASRDALAFYAEFSNFVHSLILMLAPSLRAISATTEEKKISLVGTSTTVLFGFESA